jgi:cation diffusion facilitator family transporter
VTTSPQALIRLSIAAALVTLALKSVAYLVTGAVSLFSDAAESVVNLLAAIVAYASLRYAAQPVDRSHTYGHEKIEFFSSGLEGLLIVVAAVGIGWFAAERLVWPRELEALGLGTAISLGASLINLAVGLVLLRAGRAAQSIVLEADGLHLLTDVWTSAAVLVGLGLVAATGWAAVDPLVALVVAGHITWTGVGLMRRSFDGLMDHALPAGEVETIRAAIRGRLQPGMAFHALRTRRAGPRRFVDFHLLVPGDWSVRHAHEVTGAVEQAIAAALPAAEITVHIEPVEERASWEDSALLAVERRQGETPSP